MNGNRKNLLRLYFEIRLIGITKDQYPVTNLDKRQSHFFPELTVLGDIRNPSQIEGVFQNKKCVVLLAAEHRDDVSPLSYITM